MKSISLDQSPRAPFYSDADVFVEETSDCFRFVADTDDDVVGGEVRAHTVEIYPGVTKIVIRGIEVVDLLAGELEIDMWRFHLQELTLPELATSAYEDGELVVTVPKDLNSDGSDFDHSGVGRLVFV